ncbi:hypothetical protein GCM10010305_43560 [Streptomyces termitum]|uniref:Uncharacterized protein n=1 Tax=Streptomyces termitum TaxID=67368 RepID=A0A918T572_9ACTN|nr:hypothetical protein GCM10010305_43560 [Streptomyces termitum]
MVAHDLAEVGVDGEEAAVDAEGGAGDPGGVGGGEEGDGGGDVVGGADAAEGVGAGGEGGEFGFLAGPGGGGDGAGVDLVDADAERGRLAGEGAGEGAQGGLRGAVGVVAEVGLGVDRADGDDRAGAVGRGQVREGGAGAADGAEEGAVELAAPVLAGVVDEGDEGVVDEGVEGGEAGEEGLDRRRVGDVEAVRDRAGQVGGDPLRRLLVDVRDEDPRALRREPPGGRRADAAARARDQCRLSVEALHAPHQSKDLTAFTRAWARGSAVTVFRMPLVT